MVRAAILLALVCCGLPREARADCITRSVCVCPISAATAVATGPVTAVTGSSATMQVEALTGMPPGVSVGDSLTLALGSVSDLKQGDRVLAALLQGTWTADALVDGSGNVACRYATEARLTASDVTQLVMSGTCNQDFEALMAAQKIPIPKCSDTLFGCQQAGPSAVALMVLALCRRRRPNRTT